MDDKYLNEEIERYEELWDKAFGGGRHAIGKAQKWHWEGLDEGFKFAFKNIKDIIKHGEEIEKLINKLTQSKKNEEQIEIERKAQIEVLEKILRSFAGKAITTNFLMEVNVVKAAREIEEIFIQPIENKLKELKEK